MAARQTDDGVAATAQGSTSGTNDPTSASRCNDARDRGALEPLYHVLGSRPSGVRRLLPAIAPLSAVLDDPTPHIGRIYNLTGFESADLEHYTRVFSEALGRTIRYRDVPLSEWSEKLVAAGVPEHTVHHMRVMTELTKQGRYDRMTDDLFKLTGQKPLGIYDFVKLHAAEFTREGTAG